MLQARKKVSNHKVVCSILVGDLIFCLCFQSLRHAKQYIEYQLSLRRTPLGLALCVRLREMSVRELESQPEGVKKGEPGPTLGVRFSEVSVL